MTELSILIPSRNEPFLQKTIEDIFEHIEADTEVLVGLDGHEPDKVLRDLNDRYSKLDLNYSTSLQGQRAITNHLATRASGKYVMKTDAHCSFSQGFDRVLLESADERSIVAPQMGVLDGESWTINGKKMTSRYCFDTSFVMQYDTEFTEEISETMCLQGSAWLVARENYWAWNLGDESLGSWGGQGTELGIKAWLHGGRCITNKNAYYGHVFRHNDKDFPYERGENPGKQANEELLRRFKNENIAGLIEKFNYPADWTREHVDNLKSVV